MINTGHDQRGDTIIHRLDPRVKIVALFTMSLLIFGATPAEIALISLSLAAVIRTSRLSLARTAAAVKPVGIFMALIFLMHLFLTAGTPLIAHWPFALAMTREGLAQGAYVTWQFAALVLGAALLTMTTLPSDLVGGIERLLRPLSAVGIPSQDLAVMIAMALRFMPMLMEEYEQIRMAQMARGADFTTGGIALRTRAVTALAIPLMLSAFRRADELALAMEARGYRRGTRTALHELSLAGRDFAAFTVMAIFALINIGLRLIA